MHKFKGLVFDFLRDGLIRKCILSTFCFSSITAINANNTEVVKSDSCVLKGTLENGLTYYIRNNNDETGQVFYSLILKAGSIDEDDSQSGLAHFNEHLSFDGTSHFKEGLLDGAFIQNLDKKKFFINALTTQTETVYSLMLPDSRSTLCDTALILFKDWLYEEFDSEENIKKQSDIIAKEWLEFQDVSERSRTHWYPTFYNDTKWAYRRSIGDIDIIKSADKNEIVRFRKEWYRPDLAAITIVGNIDAEKALSSLKEKFSEKPANKIYREKHTEVIPDQNERKYVISSDKDQQFSFLSIYHRVKNPDLYSPEGVKRSIMYSLINMMMSERLFDAQEKNSSAVSYMGATLFNFMKPDWVFSPNASVVNGNIKEALEVVIEEQERIARNGFLPSELEKAKAGLKNKYDYSLQYGDSRSNMDWTKVFENEFLSDIPAMLPKDEASVYLPILETVSVDDMNALHKELWTPKNSMLLITVPQKDSVNVPGKASLDSTFIAIKEKELLPYKPFDASKPLFGDVKFDNQGKIVKKESLCKELPVYKYTLSNGAQVVYYQDSTKTGNIVFEAVSKGGKSLLDQSLIPYVDLACELYNDGPVGEYSVTQYNRLINQGATSMKLTVANETESLRGHASTAKFEQLLQRIYILFNHLNLSADKYQGIMDAKSDRYISLRNSNDMLFRSFIDASLTNKKANELSGEGVSLDMMSAILKNRFASMSDFTFYFTGATHETDFEKLIAQYLGGGKKQKREKWSNDLSVKIKGEQNFKLHKGSDQRASVTYIIGSPYEMNMNTMTLLQAVNPIISKRLFGKIREELHLVYDIRSELKLKSTPSARADFEITFQCDPKDAELICYEIKNLFDKIALNGPETIELKEVRMMMLNSKRHFMNDDSFRLGCIRSHDQNLNNDYTAQINNIAFIENMTAREVGDMLNSLLNNKAGLNASFILKSEN
ncbi:MAG: insulinase family protein [Bacteroidales bacterium]